MTKFVQLVRMTALFTSVYMNVLFIDIYDVYGFVLFDNAWKNIWCVQIFHATF